MAAAEAGVADRVSFVVGDAARPAQEVLPDLVTIFEALHDMGDPVAARKRPGDRPGRRRSVPVAG